MSLADLLAELDELARATEATPLSTGVAPAPRTAPDASAATAATAAPRLVEAGGAALVAGARRARRLARPALVPDAHRVPRRQVLVPAVLLLTGTLAFTGLAAATQAGPVVTGPLTAAAVTPGKDLLLLDGPVAPAPVVPRATRVSRSAARTVAAPAAPREVVRGPRFVRPNSGGVSSPYGMRWGRLHKGLDFNGRHGSPIRAVTDGRVVSAGYDGGYGKLVTIRHADGTVTAYAHMSRILVSGGRVKAGEVIGLVGSTGNSTGPHLHFEVRVGGVAINPRPWLRARGIRV